MKKTVFAIVFVMLSITTLIAQKNGIQKDDLNQTVKQISDSLPNDWSVKTDTANPEEIIIVSQIIDLVPDLTSNEPPYLKGQCEIYIKIVPRISPDSINIIRKRNKELQDNLPPQVSKDNLKNWYNQNEKTLKILDSEPTNYDINYSYRIKFNRLPKNETNRIKFNKIVDYLNSRYKRYQE